MKMLKTTPIRYVKSDHGVLLDMVIVDILKLARGNRETLYEKKNIGIPVSGNYDNDFMEPR